MGIANGLEVNDLPILLNDRLLNYVLKGINQYNLYAFWQMY